MNSKLLGLITASPLIFGIGFVIGRIIADGAMLYVLKFMGIMLIAIIGMFGLYLLTSDTEDITL